jgi:hypothetical protein
MYTGKPQRPETRRNVGRTKQRPSVEALEGRQLMSVGPEFVVNPLTNKFVLTSANASSTNGTSVVVWTESDVSSTGRISPPNVKAQRFDASGAKAGPAFFVTGLNRIASGEFAPSVAMDAQGDFVVSWTELEVNGDTNVLAQKFNSAGVRTTSAVVPVGDGTLPELESSVAMDAKGDFVVAYTRNTTVNNQDVFAKLYGTASQLRTVDTVASSVIGGESAPSVAMTPDGRFDVAYQLRLSGTTGDIYAARYSAAGSPLGVSPVALTSAIELAPSIGMDDQGFAVVAYEKIVNNKSSVEAKRVNPFGTVGPEIDVHVSVEPEISPVVAVEHSGGAFAVAYIRNSSHERFPVVEISVVDDTNRVRSITQLNADNFPAISTSGSDDFLLTYVSFVEDGLLGRRGKFF